MKIQKTILSSKMKRTVWGVLHGQCVHTHLQIYWVSRLSLTVVKQIFWLNCSAFDSTILTWLTVSPRVSLSFFLVNWVTDSPTDSRLTTWLTGSPNLLTRVLHVTHRLSSWIIGSSNLLTTAPGSDRNWVTNVIFLANVASLRGISCHFSAPKYFMRIRRACEAFSVSDKIN